MRLAKGDVLRRVGLALLAVLMTGCWTQFRHDPAHSGSQPFETAIGNTNVSTLTQAWTGTTGSGIWSSPALANGFVYVGSTDGKLYAFDQAGVTACAGVPKSCAPLWTAATGSAILSSPAVANGVVYVGSNDGKLYAFDAAGVIGCAGVPKACAPLWTAATGSSIFSSPTVTNGVVYVGSGDGNLYAFDAAGVTGCAGVLKACAPLWTATTGAGVLSSPAVANGVVYAGSFDGKLYAFDAAGVTGCAGVPKSCAPLWTAATGSSYIWSSPAVVNGVVYVGSGDGKLYAFDAAGVTGCAGVPKTCAPLWTAAAGSYVVSSPALANGLVYVGSGDGKLYAFDAAGVTGCAGVPKTCASLWTAATGSGILSSPAVANGVVYVGSNDRKLYAFDAAGVSGCAGTPKTCAALWTAATGDSIFSSPAIESGVVYVGSYDTKLHAYQLPPPASLVQVLERNTLVAGKTSALRLPSNSETLSRVHDVRATVHQPDGSQVAQSWTGADIVGVAADGNGPSVVVKLAGTVTPRPGIYRITARLLDAQGGTLASYDLKDLNLLPTRDIRLLVVFLTHPGPLAPPGNFTATQAWYDDINASMPRLGAIYPVRDGVKQGFDNPQTAGLEYVIGTPCDGWAAIDVYYQCVYGQTRALDALPGPPVDVTIEYRPGFYAPDYDPAGDPFPGGNAEHPPVAAYSDLNRANCVAGDWLGPLGRVSTTAPACGHEIGHNFGLEPACSPHWDGALHSKDAQIDPQFAFDALRNVPYPTTIGEVMSYGYIHGADDATLNEFDWEFVRKALLGIAGC